MGYPLERAWNQWNYYGMEMGYPHPPGCEQTESITSRIRTVLLLKCKQKCVIIHFIDDKLGNYFVLNARCVLCNRIDIAGVTYVCGQKTL